MGTEYPITNATFFSLKDGIYEKISVCDGIAITEIYIEDELSHRPDLIPMPQTFSFTGEFEFCASLMALIRLFGFRYGVKEWFRMKFRKKE